VQPRKTRKTPSTSKGKLRQSEVLLKHGIRSGLEDVICQELAKGIPYKYEELTLQYTQPAKRRKYTPDIVLENSGIVIEIKGRWVTADRQKIAMVKQQYPEIDLRMVFSNSKTKISKQSSTTYGSYCDKLGIPYADKTIPDEWLKETK